MSVIGTGHAALTPRCLSMPARSATRKITKVKFLAPLRMRCPAYLISALCTGSPLALCHSTPEPTHGPIARNAPVGCRRTRLAWPGRLRGIRSLFALPRAQESPGMAFWARVLPWKVKFVRASVRRMRWNRIARVGDCQWEGVRRTLRDRAGSYGGQVHSSRPGERSADATDAPWEQKYADQRGETHGECRARAWL